MSDKPVAENEIPKEYYRPFYAGHPVIEDDHGTLRYKSKALVSWLVDCMTAAHEHHWVQRGELTHPCADLNRMSAAFVNGKFPLDEYMQFYRDMGYSLDGFECVFSWLIPEDDQEEVVDEQVCDYARLPSSGTDHGPATESKGGYSICRKCYEKIVEQEKKEAGL